MKSALIIFVRNPVLGKVKTRIAKDLGDETALAIYKQLLLHTQSITAGLQVDCHVLYSDYINSSDLWDDYYKALQAGDELGERMQNAFESLLGKGYEQVAIIGSDCYELTSEIIEEAFAALDSNAAVIGPSLDGGYYLIGMSTLIPSVFQNKNWSTESVFTDTVSDLEKGNHTFHVLRPLSDVDNAEDCKRYSSLLS